MKDQIKIFYQKLDQLEADMNEARKDADVFGSGGIGDAKYYTVDMDREGLKANCTEYKKNPLLHVLKHSAHSSTHGTYQTKSVVLWLNGFDGRQLKMHEYIAQSEKLKIVHEADGYQYAIVRTPAMFKLPTDTIWGCHFHYKSRDEYYSHDLALIKDGEIVQQSPRRWEFEQQCLNQNKDEEYIQNVHDIFLQFEPFKMFFWNLDDVDMNYMHDKWNFWIDQPSLPTNVHGNHYELIKTPSGVDRSKWYLACIIGRNVNSGVRDKTTTWFYVYSPEGKPSKSTALRQLMDYMEYYNADDTVEILTKLQTDNVLLKHIPLECTERMRYGRDKLRRVLEDIWGWDWKIILKAYKEAECTIEDDYDSKAYLDIIRFKDLV